ncbi:hypothetical protein ECZC06_53680 [Escherichia coli]|nr:hypothetical protein ECZC06_53680 [Escherichia coli]
MRIFKNAWFERFARKNRISDKALREVVELADKDSYPQIWVVVSLSSD